MKLDILEVVWVDSNVIAGWNSREWFEKTFKDGLPHCTSVGYKLYEDDQQLALAQNSSNAGGIGDVIQIPKVAIVERKVIRNGQAPDAKTNAEENEGR